LRWYAVASSDLYCKSLAMSRMFYPQEYPMESDRKTKRSGVLLHIVLCRQQAECSSSKTLVFMLDSKSLRNYSSLSN
jgi:hypothetical protein